MSNPDCASIRRVVTACASVVAASIVVSVSGECLAIVRGAPDENLLPSVAAIILRERSADEQVLSVICSGTLIAPNVVLTAAHCIEHHGPDGAPPGTHRTWFVSFQPDLRGLGTDTLDLPADAVEVRGTRAHRAFSAAENRRVGLGPSHDVGLVFLRQPVSGRLPSPLLSSEGTDLLRTGNAVLIAGYGSTSPDGGASGPGRAPGLKAHGPARLLETGTHELRVGRPSPPRTLEERAMADICLGDSGGPMFVASGDAFFVAAVTSRGYDANERCDTAGVHMRVDIVRPWILEQLALFGPSPEGRTGLRARLKGMLANREDSAQDLVHCVRLKFCGPNGATLTLSFTTGDGPVGALPPRTIVNLQHVSTLDVVCAGLCDCPGKARSCLNLPNGTFIEAAYSSSRDFGIVDEAFDPLHGRAAGPT